MSEPASLAYEEADMLLDRDDDFDDETYQALEDDDLASAVVQAHEGTLEAVSVENIILLTARLAQLLAEEADMLANMRISSIEGLQREKILLTTALDKQRKIFERHPELLDEMDRTDHIRLEQIILIFEDIMRENHRRLLIAREVNRKVIEAISESVQESTHNGLYDKHGIPSGMHHASVAVSLDERI